MPAYLYFVGSICGVLVAALRIGQPGTEMFLSKVINKTSTQNFVERDTLGRYVSGTGAT